MHDAIRRGALWAWYGATYASRARRRRQEVQTGRAPNIVLYYHRIADDRANSWTTSFATFERQMAWLTRHYDLVSLEETQRRVRSGVARRASVSVTFDDGYAENCERALPFLLAEGIPCTYFVSTRFVLDGVPFPHDVERGDRFPPNTLDELRDLAAQGIEVGAHTRNHRDLGRCRDPHQLYDEVVSAGAELQQAIDRSVRYFAFPYGMHDHLNAAAFHLAREAGYEAVCSAYGGFNYPGEDRFHLQRVHASNDLIRLKNALTGDPRKRRVARFEYAGVQPYRSVAGVA